MDLLALSRAELEEQMVGLGRKPFHGRQIHAWIHRRGITDFAQMTDLSRELRSTLAERFTLNLPRVVEETTGSSDDSTTKFLLELSDGARIETVLIPSEDRTTLCLSSQVGCAYRCTFCATGKLGLTRNLTVGEIIGSFITAQHRAKTHISNVVFMGMGEPLANLKNVMDSWQILTNPDGICLSRRRVTLSTVGLPAQIIRLSREPYPPKLVFSIGSPHDEMRRRLLPIAGRFSLEENHRALEIYAAKTRNRITIALLVAKGLNDTVEDARALHRWIRSLPVKINLLRFNETDSSLQRADEAAMESFAAELVHLGRTVILRTSRGSEINAACGQLAARSAQHAN